MEKKSFYYRRQLEKTLAPWLAKTEGVLIVGARQTGKTTLLSQLQKKYPESFFISFEDRETFVQVQKNPQAFLSSLLKTGQQNIFLDEFQRVPEISRAVKYLYDHNIPKPKFFLSGSISDYLYKKLGDSMVGRVMRFELFTLSFLESLEAKKIQIPSLNLAIKALRQMFNGQPLPVDKMKFWLWHDQALLQNLFEEYLLNGGYPAILSAAKEEKLRFFVNIQDSFWEKDLLGFLRQNQLAPLQQLTVILAKRVAFPLSLQNLACELQIDPKTVLNLIYLLKYSFWLDTLTPKASFGGEYKSKFKVYFNDNGLRNYLAQTTSLLAFEQGPALENAVFGILKRFIAYQNFFCRFAYWQTYSGGEVDFILEKEARTIAVEVKAEKLKKEKISRGMLSFIEKYQPAISLQLNRDLFGYRKIDKTDVYFLPVWCFALLI